MSNEVLRSLIVLVFVGCSSAEVADPLNHRAVYDFCERVSRAIDSATEKYSTYAAKWETYDRQGPEVRSEGAEIGRNLQGVADKETRGWFDDRMRARSLDAGLKLGLPLGWTDRGDVVERLREELNLCVEVLRANDGRQDELLKRVLDEGGSNRFTTSDAPPDVAAGLKELAAVAQAIHERVDAARRSDRSLSKP